MRAEAIHCLSAPTKLAFWRSWSIKSQDWIRWRSIPAADEMKSIRFVVSEEVSFQIGRRCCWGLRISPFSLTDLFKWIASWGIFASGSLICTKFSLITPPVESVMRRPEIPRSLSSQLLSKAPP